MELQGVDLGTGGKNEYAMDKNQQNYQGRAFIWYSIKKKIKLKLVSSELCKIVNYCNCLPCHYLWVLNLVFLASID